MFSYNNQRRKITLQENEVTTTSNNDFINVLLIQTTWLQSRSYVSNIKIKYFKLNIKHESTIDLSNTKSNIHLVKDSMKLPCIVNLDVILLYQLK